MADIIRDSSGARQKFGFGGEAGSTISSAPKLTNQWFLEFKTTDGTNAEEYSAYAKAVSQIGIQSQTQPIDKYGRRIHVPTRVDFSEVSVTLYDKVDGSTMNFVQELYKRYFKNQDMNVDSGLADTLAITGNSGRKLVEGDDAFRNFSTVTVYHWFGNQKDGTGYAQRIVLVNPVITSISFSASDYAVSETRTIDINLQPENVIFGSMYESAAIPSWMNLGLNSDQQTSSLIVDPNASPPAPPSVPSQGPGVSGDVRTPQNNDDLTGRPMTVEEAQEGRRKAESDIAELNAKVDSGEVDAKYARKVRKGLETKIRLYDGVIRQGGGDNNRNNPQQESGLQKRPAPVAAVERAVKTAAQNKVNNVKNSLKRSIVGRWT